MKVGLVQMHCLHDQKENIKKAISGIREVAAQGAQIVCLPELFTSPYFCQTREDRFFSLAESVPGPTTEMFSLLSKELKIVLLLSIFEKDPQETYYNTTAVIGTSGDLLGIYRKMHIPDDPENGYDEAYYFTKGNLGFKSFQTPYAKIAPMICWDQWYPEGARINAAQGAQILFYPTAIGWPKKPTEARIDLNSAEHAAWQTIQQSHGIANNVFVVAVNRVGPQDHLNFWGTSFVSDPYGRILAKASSHSPENLVVDCDLSLIESMRKDWPFLDYRRVRVEA